MVKETNKQDFEEVVSYFQIELLASVSALFGKKGRAFGVKPLIYGDLALKNQPFDLRIHIESSDLNVYLYTDGGDANGKNGSLRMERDDYSNLRDLRNDFLEKLERLL